MLGENFEARADTSAINWSSPHPTSTWVCSRQWTNTASGKAASVHAMEA